MKFAARWSIWVYMSLLARPLNFDHLNQCGLENDRFESKSTVLRAAEIFLRSVKRFWDVIIKKNGFQKKIFLLATWPQFGGGGYGPEAVLKNIALCVLITLFRICRVVKWFRKPARLMQNYHSFILKKVSSRLELWARSYRNFSVGDSSWRRSKVKKGDSLVSLFSS